MTAVQGLMPPEGYMETKKTQAQAGDDYKTKNKVIKECLINDEKRAQMNAAMGLTIAREIYDQSLARVLLMPHLVKDGKCPVFSEGEHGPVVVVHLVQTEKRVLGCRAYRDSLREEEQVTTVRDIDFLVMRGQGIRPSSFPLSNVCTLRWPDLNGSAYSMVERARTRLRDCLAMDETKVAMRALSWVCARFGRLLWAKSAQNSLAALENAASFIGVENNPIILCSPKNLSILVNSGLLKFSENLPKKIIDPVGSVKVDNLLVPVHIVQGMPNHSILVVPSGQALGEMPIFIEPEIRDYDKPERLIKGWLLFQDQSMVFTGARATNVIHLGGCGLVEMAKSIFWRVVAW